MTDEDIARPQLTIIVGRDGMSCPGDSVSEEDFERATPGLGAEKTVTQVGGPWTGVWDHVGDRWVRRSAARALWECLLLSGADVSGYAYETCTEEGREVGFREWTRHGSYAEVVAAVRQLREDYDAP